MSLAAIARLHVWRSRLGLALKAGLETQSLGGSLACSLGPVRGADSGVVFGVVFGALFGVISRARLSGRPQKARRQGRHVAVMSADPTSQALQSSERIANPASASLRAAHALPALAGRRSRCAPAH